MMLITLYLIVLAAFGYAAWYFPFFGVPMVLLWLAIGWAFGQPTKPEHNPFS